MRLLPRTLLVRVFLLLASLIIVTVGTWLTLFQAAEREPRARQLAQLVGSIANMSRAALVHADPNRRVELIRELSATEGLRLLPADDDDRVEALADTAFNRRFADETRRLLGDATRLAQSVNGNPGLWTSFWIGSGSDADEYWLDLPETRIDPGIAWQWFGWGSVVVGLALFVAWLIVSRIARPLRAIADAAAELAREHTPAALPENGPDELARVSAAFNRMASELGRVAAERAEVLAGISHDLRTPLARLRLEAEMSVADADARAGMVGDLEQMDAIIGQFLDYAKGVEAEPLADVDACELIAAVAARHGPAAGAATTCDCVAPLPVSLRRTAMTRALGNLVDNARKYAGDAIELAAYADGELCVFEVRDRGPGIPADETERLKRAFTRLERARSDVKGTGLGLAIVERIAAGHGGRLELLPRPGGGLIARILVRRSGTA